MKYRELKEKMEEMSEEQLDQEISFKSRSLNGTVNELKLAKENWYCQDWAYPFVDLAPESWHIRERRYDEAKWDDEDEAIYKEWLEIMHSSGAVIKKGELYLKVEEDKRIRHRSITDCNAGW